MSRPRLLTLIATLALAVFTNGARAEDSGVAKEKMIQALQAAAAGECRGDIMSPLLLDACETQTEANQKLLQPLGKISGAKYLGIQELPNGKAEAYRVEFAKGSMVWLASLDGSGKLLVLWSNAQVRAK